MQADSSILHPRVREALESLQIRFEALPCDPSFADTAEFCAHYGFAPGEVCNTILVVVKKEPREYVGCLVRSDMKLDVNHRVADAVAFKRLSFASADETAVLSGMEIGGVTLVGLPATMPLLIDERVFDSPTVILGGGNRTSKIRLEPAELMKLPGVRVAAIAVPR